MKVNELKQKIKVVQYGLGAIGSEIVKFALQKKYVEIVGAVDIDKNKVGKDLGEVIGIDQKIGITVSDNPNDVFSKVEADIVLHSTSSYLKNVYPQLELAIKAKANIISTAEELVYPFFHNPEIAEKIDRLAKQYQVSVLGTGVNPGFLMDTLIISFTSICQNIKQIKATRVIDASQRRLPFQKKMGVGLTPDEFNKNVENKIITGHVGLTESVAMIADSLGWKLDSVQLSNVEPEIAKASQDQAPLKIDAGKVVGLKQIAYGMKDRENVITLEFQAGVMVKEQYDSIYIEGKPNVDLTIKGGIHGDLATVAIIVNMIPKVLDAKPGLLTMVDLPIPSAMSP